MQELIDRLSEELLAAGFTLHPDIRLFYRVTDAGTFFYVDLYIKEGAIDILYGVVPTQNELGPCAAIHDFSGCLKFSRLIAWGSDIEERLAEAGAQIRKVYAEYSSSTPEQLKVHVADRRKRLYSIATEVLAPYKFEYRPSPNMQLWARSISPDISIEYRMESSPGLKHNGLICVHDRRDPDRAQLYWRNAHVNGETRIFWEDMDEETVLALTENALRATIIPLIELDIEKLLDERFFTEERGWYRMRHAIADMQLFGHITGRLTDMGMTRSAKYKNKYFMRLSPSQAIIANIYDDNGKLEIMYGLKNDAIIFEDGIDWLAQVGGVIDPPDTCMQAVVSNRAEADIILEDIRRFISENTRRRGSFMRRIFNRIKSITGRHTP